MTRRKHSFEQIIDRAERRFYSLNYLLAEYQPMESIERDKAIRDHKVQCRQYASRDLAVIRFHKNITTPLGSSATLPDRSGSVAGDDPSSGRAAEPVPERPELAANAAAYFVRWACCLAVEGQTRSIICDTQRNTFIFVPGIVVELLELCKDKTLGEIHAHYDNQHNEQIDEYFAHLVARDYGFFSSTPSRLPEMSLDWRNPRPITNCVIDFAPGTEHPLASISEQLSQLFCQALELRFFQAISALELERYLEPFHESTIRSISLIVGHHPSLDLAALDRLLRRHKRITQICVHSTADHDEVIRIGVQTTVQYTRERITSAACCGNVSPRYFNCHLETFTESVRFNSCLHRKIGIDAHGAIRNCPAMLRSFGDVNSTSLASVVATDAFQAPGRTNKDQIAICQDCEFRYICHDCRVYISDPDQPLSKPSRCRYNPYEGRWE